jgi:hypothetical protein
MSILNQIPTPSFEFNAGLVDNRGALALVRQGQDITGQSTFPFVRNGVKNVPDKLGILRAVPANEPAVTFDGQGRNLGYLAESARTNLVANPGLGGGVPPTGWARVFSGGTAISENSSKFDSTIGVKRIAFTATNQRDFIGRSISLTQGQTYTWSIFVEDISEITGDNVIAAIATSSTGIDASIVQSQITASDVVNGYAQKTFTVVNTSTFYTVRIGIGCLDLATGSVTISSPQVELGNFQSSRIANTDNTSSTRPADILTYTNAQDLIGQTEGVLYAEVDWNIKPEPGSPIVGILALNVGANNLQNAIVLGIERQSGGANRVFCFVQVSNTTQAGLFGSSITSGRYKIAFAYKQDDFVLYVNGAQIATDTSGSVPVTNEIRIGTRFNTDAFVTNDPIRSVRLWKTTEWLTDDLAKLLTRV